MTTKGIRADDIVKVNKRGVIFHAFVTGEPQDGVVPLHPLERNISYASAKAREIVTHWARRGRRRTTQPEPEPSDTLAIAA
jgi:hypothetical protein